MTDEVALAVLPSVVYRSGQWLDLARLAAEGRSRGVLVGFDCSHSVGTVPHFLSRWGVDFAFWCSYKYLNGGSWRGRRPLSEPRHFGALPGLAGWFGSRRTGNSPCRPDSSPLKGPGPANRYAVPAGMAPLIGSLEMMREAGNRRDSRQIAGPDRLSSRTGRIRDWAENGFVLATPPEADRRGGHLALVHPEASRICGP